MTSDYSLSDIAAVSGGNRGGMGFGGDGAWWIIILFLFGIFGWGNNGFGGFGGGGGQGEVQRGFDHSSVINKLDGLSNGLCDSTYALNNAITNGFSNAEIARCNQQAAIMQQLNNMSAQNQACCCETQRQIERGFADTNYNMATQACEIKQTINDSTRAVLDFLTKDKIDTLQAENQALRFSASQIQQNALLTTAMTAQTNQIIGTLNPAPIPAYVVANPNAAYCGGYVPAACGC